MIKKKTRAIPLQMYNIDEDLEIAIKYLIKNDKKINTATSAIKFMCRAYINDKARIAMQEILKTLEEYKNTIDTEVIKEGGVND